MSDPRTGNSRPTFERFRGLLVGLAAAAIAVSGVAVAQAVSHAADEPAEAPYASGREGGGNATYALAAVVCDYAYDANGTLEPACRGEAPERDLHVRCDLYPVNASTANDCDVLAPPRDALLRECRERSAEHGVDPARCEELLADADAWRIDLACGFRLDAIPRAATCEGVQDGSRGVCEVDLDAPSAVCHVTFTPPPPEYGERHETRREEFYHAPPPCEPGIVTTELTTRLDVNGTVHEETFREVLEIECLAPELAERIPHERIVEPVVLEGSGPHGSTFRVESSAHARVTVG